MYKATLLLIALLALEAVIVWQPFNSELVGYQSGSESAKTAGQITESFHLVQEVPAKLLKMPTPKRRITHWWKSRKNLYTNNPNCFAIRFASYDRANRGQLAVSYRQGNSHQRWLIQASELGNELRRFCPSAELSQDEPIQISVDGIDSQKGQAATVRLSRSNLKPAVINGEKAEGRSLTLQLVYFQHVGPGEIFSLDRGAFAGTCALSLGIIMLVLVTSRKKPRRSDKPSPLS